MADIALATRTVQIYEGALSTAQQDLTAQQNIQTSFQNKANALNDKAAGLPNGSDEQQATLEKAANYQSQANNQAQFITRAQANVDNAQSQLDYAKQELVTAQQQQDNAQSQTATDAVADKTTNPAPATQNTGTSVPAGAKPLADSEKQALSTPPKEANNDVQVVNGPSYSGAGGGRGSYTGYNAADETASRENTQIGGPAQDRVVTANPLGAYSSYTYNINLHVLTAADYKTMINSPENFTPSKNIISGANKYNKTTGSGTLRSEEFTDDFYFDDLQFMTIIGPNAQSRSSNVAELKFTIIEPYGMTLINRLVDIQREELDGANYLDTPYLLEINFFGTDDHGNQKAITDQQKYICIKITNMKIKVSGKGAEYAIQAVPYHYQANFSSAQALKSNFNITAGTVGEYFSNDITTAQVTEVDNVREQTAARTAADKKAAEQAAAYGGRATGGVVTVDSSGKDTTTTPAPPPPTINTQSLPGAYNLWNLREAKNGNTDVADQIRFNIDPDILNSKIVDPNKNTVRNTPAVDPNTASKGNNGTTSGPNAVGPDLSKSVHNLNAGTQILAIIDMVMLNSDYIIGQLNDSSIQNKPADDRVNSAQQLSDLKNGQPVNWYRVVPQIELTSFDRVRNKWGKIITYNIQKYTYYNDRHDAAKKSPPPPAVKDYQYIYTGHNTEVIDFNIEFNTLHFVPIQVNKSNTTGLNVAKVDDAGKDNGKKETNQLDVQPIQKELYSGDQSTIVGGSETRIEAQNAGAFAKNIYTAVRADMLNVKLNIMGDPQFIKQDDIHYNPNYLGLNYTEQFVPSGTQGSLAMDNGEIFCNITFKTPVDFDDNTGMLKKDGRYSRSYFSGYYKVLTVNNDFKGGKFTQTLDLVRYANQSNSGEARTGWDNQTTDSNRTGDTTLNNKSQNPATSGYNLQKPVNLVGPLQTSAPLKVQDGDGLVIKMPIEYINNPKALTNQVPATNTSLADITQKGPTVPIGPNANAEGEAIVLAGAPG